MLVAGCRVSGESVHSVSTESLKSKHEFKSWAARCACPLSLRRYHTVKSEPGAMQKAELCAGLGNHSRCLQGLAFYDLVLRFFFFFFWFNRKDKLFPHHATILYLDQSSIQSLVCSHQCFASLKVLLLSTGSAQRTCPRKE